MNTTISRSSQTNRSNTRKTTQQSERKINQSSNKSIDKIVRTLTNIEKPSIDSTTDLCEILDLMHQITVETGSNESVEIVVTATKNKDTTICCAIRHDALEQNFKFLTTESVLDVVTNKKMGLIVPAAVPPAVSESVPAA